MNTEDVVEGCLGEVLSGTKSAGECAALYPGIPGLEGELRAAMTVRAWSAPSIRAEANRRIEAQLRHRVRASRPAPILRRAAISLRTAAALAALAAVFAGIGTVAASARSLPGEALYGVKRAREAVQLWLTPASGSAFLHAALAGRRLDEMAALAARGAANGDVLASLSHEVTVETSIAIGAVDRAPPERRAAILGTLVRETERQQYVLRALTDAGPPELQAALAQALDDSARNHSSALERLEEERSGGIDAAPGTPPSSPDPAQSEEGQALFEVTADSPALTEEATDVLPGPGGETASPDPARTSAAPEASPVAPDCSQADARPEDCPATSPP